MKGRVKYCDSLKAISIILVILIHVFAIYRDLYINSNRVYYAILSFGDSFTRVAVPIFFMITGIFMLNKKSEKSYKEYFWKRIPKLVIPFLIFSIIYYIYEAYKVNEPLSLLYFLQTFTTYGGFKYHFWFMYEIIRVYLLIPFISILVKGLTKKDLKTLITLIFVMGNVISFIQLFSWRYNLNLFKGIALSNLTICINYLLLGYYLYKYDIKKETRKKIYILGIISIILMPIFDLLYIDNMRNDAVFTISSIFPIFPSMSIFLLFKYNYDKIKIPAIIEKATNKIAANSLYIYMIHVIVLEYVNKYLQKIITPNRFIKALLLIILVLVLTVILSYIGAIIFDYIYRWISKGLSKLWSKKKITN